MKVSLDDGVTWQEAETVRVMYEQVDAPLRGEHPHDLFFTFTHEGLITDLWADLGDGRYNNQRTAAFTLTYWMEVVLGEEEVA